MDYPNKFILDLHDSGYWMARWHKETNPIGRDKAHAEKIIEKLNDAHRPNLEMSGNNLMVCWNLHDKSEGCEYEILVAGAV